MNVTGSAAAALLVGAVVMVAVGVDTLEVPGGAGDVPASVPQEETATWRASCPDVVSAGDRRDAVAAVSWPTADTGQSPGRLALARPGTAQTLSTQTAGRVIGGPAQGSGAATAEATGGLAPGAMSVVSSIDGGEEGRGLAVAACPQPTGVYWFVGVGASPGRRDELVLANPSDSPAVADLVFYGPEGPIEVPGSDGVVVQPSATERVAIDALIPDIADAALKVSTRQGVLAAAVRTEEIDGLVPRGAAYIPPSPPPTAQPWVVGIPVADERRLVVTSPVEAATVEVLAMTADGPVPWPDAPRVDIPAGSTAALDLADPPAGFAGSMLVRSNAAVGATLRSRQIAQTTRTPSGSGRRERKVPTADLAWSAATRPGGSTLVLPGADLDAPLEVTVAAEAGPVTLEVTVNRRNADRPAKKTVEVAARRGAVVRIAVPAGTGPAVVAVRRTAGQARFVAGMRQDVEVDAEPLLASWPGEPLGGRVAVPPVRNAGPGLP